MSEGRPSKKAYLPEQVYISTHIILVQKKHQHGYRSGERQRKI